MNIQFFFYFFRIFYLFNYNQLKNLKTIYKIKYWQQSYDWAIAPETQTKHQGHRNSVRKDPCQVLTKTCRNTDVDCQPHKLPRWVPSFVGWQHRCKLIESLYLSRSMTYQNSILLRLRVSSHFYSSIIALVNHLIPISLVLLKFILSLTLLFCNIPTPTTPLLNPNFH